MDDMEDEDLLIGESPTDSTGRLTISPFFDVPEGVDFEYEEFDVDAPEEEVFEPLTDEATDGNEPSYSGEEVSPSSEQFLEELDTSSEENSILAPTELIIISQTPRIAQDGTVFVDVIVGFEEADGAENYEVRVSKA